MKTIQDMIDNHDGEYYGDDHRVDADWSFYEGEDHSSVAVLVYFSASDTVGRFVDKLGIDREDALQQVRDMIHAVTYQECRDMPFDLETYSVGEEVLCTDISGDYNGEDMEALTRKFAPAFERVVYYTARIENPDLR